MSHQKHFMNFSFKPFPRIETHFTSIVYEDRAQRYQRGKKYTCLNKGFLASTIAMRGNRLTLVSIENIFTPSLKAKLWGNIIQGA